MIVNLQKCITKLINSIPILVLIGASWSNKNIFFNDYSGSCDNFLLGTYYNRFIMITIDNA